MKKRLHCVATGDLNDVPVILQEIPYFVDPDELTALGVDPDQYFRSGSGGWAGWMLDRTKDAALIGRLQSINEPHKVVQ
jgi:hypothetical protein